MNIAVAVSGGGDSLLALALLKEQGHTVTAAHARFLSPAHDPRGGHVTTGLETACHALGVPLRVFDLSEQFKRRIIAPFIDAYARGLTPNPCAVCNAAMKFGLLLDAVRKDGSDRLATGHFVRLAQYPEIGAALARGADPVKEQSYFLSLVPRDRLVRAVFPLGDMLKKDVPGELEKRGLTAPLPSESQEICFVPGDDYRAFLKAHAPGLPGPGPIRLQNGRIIGEHQGLWRYTVGQRKGLGISYSEPLYVLDKDLGDNALVVGPAHEVPAETCRADRVNVLIPPRAWPETVLARIRYRQKAMPARARIEDNILRIRFAEPRDRPSPGQVTAIYDQRGFVLAAGIIV